MKKGKKNGYASISKKEYLDFFTDDLRDIYWVEKTLTKELPKMSKKANAGTLSATIDAHLKETETHVSNVEKAFGLLGKKATAKKCEAMAGILEEAKELLDETKGNAFLTDVAIILAAQKVEHYEITSYGNLITVAGVLGYPEIAKVLEGNLKQEKAADVKLTKAFQAIHKAVELT